MANDFFKFKQFTIRQDRCAMKVTTLACIQGAWLPDIKPKHILDIGAGTGLLSLMAAQKYECKIDAVEIEQDAFSQLKENSLQSPWGNRINCHHDDIINFARHNSSKYDLIISNPPFYKNQLKSSKAKINHARHEVGLTIEELIDASSRLISDSGKISILLPPIETTRLTEYCKRNSLFFSNQLVISDSEKKEPKAIVTILSKIPSNPIIRKFIIKNDNGTYSSEFISLLDAYYLYL